MMVSPYEVKSPKAHWTLIDVLFTNASWSLALGEWDGKRRFACRWNGKDNELGNPMSRGIPTWFVLPTEFMEHLEPLIPKDKRSLVAALLKRAA
jgi:hypothetical protein